MSERKPVALRIRASAQTSQHTVVNRPRLFAEKRESSCGSNQQGSQDLRRQSRCIRIDIAVSWNCDEQKWQTTKRKRGRAFSIIPHNPPRFRVPSRTVHILLQLCHLLGSHFHLMCPPTQ